MPIHYGYIRTPDSLLAFSQFFTVLHVAMDFVPHPRNLQILQAYMAHRRLARHRFGAAVVYRVEQHLAAMPYHRRRAPRRMWVASWLTEYQRRTYSQYYCLMPLLRDEDEAAFKRLTRNVALSAGKSQSTHQEARY